MKTNAYRSLATRPRRITKTVDYKAGPDPRTEVSYFDYLAEDLTRLYVKTTRQKWPKPTKPETWVDTIVVGEFQYTQIDGGDWIKERVVEVPATKLTAPARDPVSCNVRQLTLTVGFVDNLPARIYDVIEYSNGTDGIVLTSTRTSIGYDDSILAESVRVQVLEAGMYPRDSIYQSHIKYEYDPRIKIEAPIK